MLNDLITHRISKMDEYSKDEHGNIAYDNKMGQFIENLINDKSLDVKETETYIDYDLRIGDEIIQNQPSCLVVPSITPDLNSNNLMRITECNKCDKDYVSSVLNKEKISLWKPQSNVFISAGTGKGKNTFIKEQLLKHYSYGYGNIIIFENRESLLSQQKIELINSIDPEALKYNDFEKDNMVIFGKQKNIMIISYQKTALKLLYEDNSFKQFLCNVRFAVFDEAHYLLDDSMFNKGVNIIANMLLNINSCIMSQATKIFMSGSMDEIFIYLQTIGYNISDFNDLSNENQNTMVVNQAIYHDYICRKNVHILNLPTDYSYISPYVYTNYDDIIPKLQNDDKWLVYINSKSKGNELAYKINLKYGENTAIFINAENKYSKDIKPIYELLLKESRFECKVLIATNVIYNGINIKDASLKNIVISETTIPIMKQLIGRKRIINNDNELNVYFPKCSLKEIKKRFSINIKEYFEIISNEKTILGNTAAINGLLPGISKYMYVIPEALNVIMENNTVCQYMGLKPLLNHLANMKLHFDTMFYLYVLHKFNIDEYAYIRALLEHLGIGSKFDSLTDITILNQEQKNEKAKEKLSGLLDNYIDKPIIDKCISNEYILIPKFIGEVNNIYMELWGKSIDTQWKNKSRTISAQKINDFINELKLDYIVEISKKDKDTDAKTLTVTHKSK